MPASSKWMIGIGWALPVAVGLGLLVTRPQLIAVGKFTGGFLLILVLVPTFLATVVLQLAGTVTALVALRRKSPFSRIDRLVLAAGAVAVLGVLGIAGAFVYTGLRYP